MRHQSGQRPDMREKKKKCRMEDLMQLSLPKGPVLTKEDKETLRQKELKQMKAKYGLQVGVTRAPRLKCQLLFYPTLTFLQTEQRIRRDQNPKEPQIQEPSGVSPSDGGQRGSVPTRRRARFCSRVITLVCKRYLRPAATRMCRN